jgi:Uncharacterized conserved protein containing a ferredoxin-like domain
VSNTFVGMPAFPEAAAVALVDTQLRRNLAHATQVIRTKRETVVGELDDWEELRLAGAAIKTGPCATSPPTWSSSRRPRPPPARRCTGRATAPRPTPSWPGWCGRRARTRS